MATSVDWLCYAQKGVCLKDVCRRKELMKHQVKMRKLLAKTRLFLDVRQKWGG